MSEPRTEAGRRMLGRWWPEIPRQADRDMSRGRENATAAILAIEHEARAAADEEIARLERALQACEEAPYG